MMSFYPSNSFRGRSHDNSVNYQMELSRNWHWMWSTFYYNKKYKGFLVSFIKVLPKLVSSITKYLFFLVLRNNEKKNIRESLREFLLT